MAIPGFTAERSLPFSSLSYRVTRAKQSALFSRLLPMQPSDDLCADYFDCSDWNADGAVAGGRGGRDAGTPDAGTPDAGTPDAGTPDAGSEDTYLPQPVRVRCYALTNDGHVVEVQCNNPNQL